MNAFLKQQDIRNENRRKKTLRLVFKRIQQISLVLLGWSVFLGIIYGFYHVLFEKNIFQVKNIEIEGKLLHVAENEIRDIANNYVGKNLFAADLKKLQNDISENPWAKEVAVTRKLPNTVWIFVSEYEPYALLVADDVYLVDKDGVVFKKLGGNEEKNFPAITGFSKNDDMGPVLKMMEIYSRSEIADYFNLAEVNLDENRGYSVMLPGFAVRLGFEGADKKLEKLYKTIGAITSGRGKISYIDLNMPGKVVVKYES